MNDTDIMNYLQNVGVALNSLFTMTDNLSRSIILITLSELETNIISQQKTVKYDVYHTKLRTILQEAIHDMKLKLEFGIVDLTQALLNKEEVKVVDEVELVVMEYNDLEKLPEDFINVFNGILDLGVAYGMKQLGELSMYSENNKKPGKKMAAEASKIYFEIAVDDVKDGVDKLKTDLEKIIQIPFKFPL